jgi:hypothetical protein
MYILVIINEDKIWGLIKLLFPNFLFFILVAGLFLWRRFQDLPKHLFFFSFSLKKKEKKNDNKIHNRIMTFENSGCY